MAKPSQDDRQAKCRHYLWLTLRFIRGDLQVWARCSHCKRGWLLGTHAEVVAGLSRFEGVAS